MPASQMSDVTSSSDILSDSEAMLPDEQRTLELVQQVLRSFQNGQSGMVFACGGKVPIHVANSTAEQTTAAGARTCQPVNLHWDPSSASVPAADCKLQFPLDQTDSKAVQNMQQLLRDMQPATFGYQGQNILDESYRKASKLDPSHFTCNFNPYELGIVDEVARILLPEFKHQAAPTEEKIVCDAGDVIRAPEKVMRAELYKLNVYTGPSGHFKAHVDTPRSTEQIGSLVVCLPCVHQGGQLEVRHEGRTITFDWSMPETARPEIQWAAFYSDCEHEVLEVTSGHRITLTYNLYASTDTGTQQVGNGAVDPVQMPLYGMLHPLFMQENFMPDGGYLGVYTSHAYPHTSTSARLPYTLKGIDVAVWETFRSLGCGVRLRPVLELPGGVHYGHAYEEPCPEADLTDTSSEGYHSHTDDEELRFAESEAVHQEGHQDSGEYDDCDKPMADTNQPLPENSESGASGPEHLVTGIKDGLVINENNDGDHTMAEAPPALPIGPGRWEIDADEVQALQQEAKEYGALPGTEFKGLEPKAILVPRPGEDNRDNNEKGNAAKFEQIGLPSGCRVLGNSLGFQPEGFIVQEDEEMDELLKSWAEQKPPRQERTAKQSSRVRYDEVAWLNHHGHFKEPQINYGVYGNEAEPSIMYSNCGIVAQVPSFLKRKTLLGKE